MGANMEILESMVSNISDDPEREHYLYEVELKIDNQKIITNFWFMQGNEEFEPELLYSRQQKDLCMYIQSTDDSDEAKQFFKDFGNREDFDEMMWQLNQNAKKTFNHIYTTT